MPFASPPTLTVTTTCLPPAGRATLGTWGWTGTLGQTRSVWQALLIGFLHDPPDLTRRSGLYVLCPPLAVNFVNVIFPMRQIGSGSP